MTDLHTDISKEQQAPTNGKGGGAETTNGQTHSASTRTAAKSGAKKRRTKKERATSPAHEIVASEALRPIPLREVKELRSKNARIWLKIEWQDPLGTDPLRTIKRKPATFLFRDVIDKGYVDSGKILISATSGNLGIEFGMLCHAAGHTFCAVVPAAIPDYNLRLLRTLGIHVLKTEEQETCPREFTVFFARGYAHEFHHRLVNVDQYHSWLNPLAHGLTTARELFTTKDVKVDHVVASVGSCGTICGILNHVLATKNTRANVVGVQPAVNQGVPGTHVIKGDCRWSPENYSPVVLPGVEIETVDQVDSYALTAKLWEWGIHAGPSTGMALAHAYRMIRNGATGNFVITSPDSNFKYGDLIADRLSSLGNEILERYPELELDDTLTTYKAFVKEHLSLERMLSRVARCYPAAEEGKMFRVQDIEDIVTGKAF